MSMTTDEGAASVLGRGPASMSGAATPGETLRDARQLAGLSQEDIANKLKLSPRQIAAIETGDWSALPERTFTRGFMRNYARLVGVDPDSLGIDQAPSQPQAASQLKPTPTAIGEIVHEADRNGFSAARWVVPALLIAALAAGILYFQGQHWFGWDASKMLSTSVTPSLKSAVAAKAESAEKADATVAAATPAPPVVRGGDAPNTRRGHSRRGCGRHPCRNRRCACGCHTCGGGTRTITRAAALTCTRTGGG